MWNNVSYLNIPAIKYMINSINKCIINTILTFNIKLQSNFIFL